MNRCQNGHDLTLPDSVYVSVRSDFPGGPRERRECAVCKRASTRERARRRRAKERAGRLPKRAPQSPHGTNTGLELVRRSIELEAEWWNAPAWRRLEIEQEQAQLAEARTTV